MMTDCEKYTFIYKDLHGNWNVCTNPVFIAEHKECKAIPKSEGIEALAKYVKRYRKDLK